jgi:general secretion pathway protein I
MRSRTRGFTLIEVLAALVIVALGMLGVIQAVTQTARNGTYLRDKTFAHWIALNLITERRLAPQAPEVAESSEEIEYAGRRWRWTIRVTQTGVESLRRMDVSVRPVDAPEGTALASVTGFYGTAIGPSGGGSLTWGGGTGATGPGGGPDGGPDGNPQGEQDKDDERGTRPRPTGPTGPVPPQDTEPEATQ